MLTTTTSHSFPATIVWETGRKKLIRGQRSHFVTIYHSTFVTVPFLLCFFSYPITRIILIAKPSTTGRWLFLHLCYKYTLFSFQTAAQTYPSTTNHTGNHHLPPDSTKFAPIPAPLPLHILSFLSIFQEKNPWESIQLIMVPIALQARAGWRKRRKQAKVPGFPIYILVPSSQKWDRMQLPGTEYCLLSTIPCYCFRTL